MSLGCYLNPHLDNSHDRFRKKYRVLNSLYYVSPHWQPQWGGNLQLWPEGLKGKPVEIPSVFDRLVIMETHKHSLHRVTPVVHNDRRCCVSNYYFSEKSPIGFDYYHSTSFYGWPDEPLKKKMLLRASALMRTIGRKTLAPIFDRNIMGTGHYRKSI